MMRLGFFVWRKWLAYVVQRTAAFAASFVLGCVGCVFSWASDCILFPARAVSAILSRSPDRFPVSGTDGQDGRH